MVPLVLRPEIMTVCTERGPMGYASDPAAASCSCMFGLSARICLRTLSLWCGAVVCRFGSQRKERGNGETYVARSALQYTVFGHFMLASRGRIRREKAGGEGGSRFPTTSWNGMNMIRPGSAAN